MAKLVWDAVGTREYETGTSKGVLFVQDNTGAHAPGVPWNGLVSVKQSPEGGEPTDIYAHNIIYLSLQSAENLKGSIDAYTYPDEFAECDGSAELIANIGVYAGQQTRKQFGLVYSTVIGNDTAGNDYGEKIHIIYNAKVSPSERAYETINDSPSAITFSWSFSTTPVSVDDVPGISKPTAYVMIDSTKVNPQHLAALKDLIYGTDSEPATMPTLAELMTILNVVPTTTTTTTIP